MREPMNAEQAIAAASAVVSPVWLVGGSVRDVVLERPADDFDFATPLSPEQVEAAVRSAGRRAYLTGKRFGTIGFTERGHKLEVTTFRAESYDGTTRHPQVRFLERLEDDLARRDFTINAMAMDAEGALIDPHGGRADLKAGVVRCVGDARERFAEDPLRILRAARFVSQLDFTAEERTVAEMARGSRGLLRVARERWVAELDKLLVGPAAGRGLRLLGETGCLRWVLPELHLQIGYEQDSPYHDRTLFEHTVAVVEAAPPEVELRWAALLHDLGKPYARVDKPGRATYVHHERISAELVSRLGPYLRWSAARTASVRALVLGHMEADSPLREADDSAKATERPA